MQISAAACFAFASLVACRESSLSVGSRDAAQDGTVAAGSGGQTIAPTLGTGGSGLWVGTGGAGGAALSGGASGGTLDANEDSLDPCAFGTLWDAVVDAAQVIGYCGPVAVCDSNAGTSDAGVAACSPFSEGLTLDLLNGDLVIRDAFGSESCWRLVFDGEGRLVSGGRVDITAWADCRWAYYAGKTYYYFCVSE